MTEETPSITALLPPAHILLVEECRNKKRTFEKAAARMEELSGLSRSDLFQGFMARERQGATAIGFYGAIPHTHSAQIDKPLCVMVRLKKHIEFDETTMPAATVNTLIFLVAPENEDTIHLSLLAAFSMLLADEEIMNQLSSCPDPDSISSAIAQWEKIQRQKIANSENTSEE